HFYSYKTVGLTGALGHGGAPVQQGHEKVTQLGLQNIVEELERVVMNGRTLGLESKVGTIGINMRVKQSQQTEDALQFLVHGLLEGACQMAILSGAQHMKDLIGTVMAENFG